MEHTSQCCSNSWQTTKGMQQLYGIGTRVLISDDWPYDNKELTLKLLRGTYSQDTLRAVIIKKHLCLPWARMQVYSIFLAQGKQKSFFIMNALNVSWTHCICLGLAISVQINWLTGKMHLTACSGNNVLCSLKKYPWILIFFFIFQSLLPYIFLVTLRNDKVMHDR